MKFKNDLARSDYEVSPSKLKQICEDFKTFSLFHGVEPLITRVREGVCGDSGVHEQGRAVDIRDQYVLSDGRRGRLYTNEQAANICILINDKYRREDGKPTCLHHSFTGPSGVPQPVHFHVQIPIAWLKEGEPAAKPS